MPASADEFGKYPAAQLAAAGQVSSRSVEPLKRSHPNSPTPRGVMSGARLARFRANRFHFFSIHIYIYIYSSILK